jgi:hypothetical protein
MLPTLILALQVMQAGAPPLPVNPPEGLPGARADANVYSGRANQTRVKIPRFDSSVRIDGVLDEPVWQDAALLTGFSEYRPVEGRAAADSTEVRVWYSAHAIYFGVRAFGPAGSTRAKLADRDKIDSDDYVQLMLDTFNDRRQAMVFGVNPLGVQADGTRTEGAAGGATNNNVDLNPDFTFESKGHVTGFGYEVEVRIPFKTLRYRSAALQDWGLNIFRKVQYSGDEETWTKTGKGASFLAQSGFLTGLHSMTRGLVLELNPVATERIDGGPAAVGTGWNYANTPAFGGNLRWGFTSNLTLNATIKPDFSQVEADVGQAPKDARFAILFPEKRPFFIEGSELFITPNNVVYTRSIGAPVAAAKVTGKASGVTIGLLSAVDDRSLSDRGDANPVFSIVRLRRDLPGSSTAGITYADREDGALFNRVFNFDTRLIFRKLYFVQLQYAHSFTHEIAGARDGSMWQLWYDGTGKYFGFGYNVLGISPGFRARAGFIPRTNFVKPNFTNRVSFYGKRGALVQQWAIANNTNAIWLYRDFFDRARASEWHSALNNTVNLRGGWIVNINGLFEEYRFDKNFHAGQYVQQAPSTIVPYYIAQAAGTRSVLFGATTSQHAQFGSSLKVTVGKDADFFEHATANVLRIDGAGNWQPSRQVRVEGIYTQLQHWRERDGTALDVARIPRLKVEYQLNRAIFLRLVGQYTARSLSAPRDPRTDLPILVLDASKGYVPIKPTSSNNFRVDWLFSYKPTPGTVVFAGYGSSLREVDAFSFRDLTRVTDGFFFKVSYLFRM